MEDYYLKNQTPFDNSISLEGINPKHLRANLKIDATPLVKQRHEFKFDELSKVKILRSNYLL